MTKALFITTQTNEVENHIAAWDAINDTAAVRVTFDHMGLRNDWPPVEAAINASPDVIFYVGACGGRGTPVPSTLRRLRDIAPTVNICSDAADRPWHQLLRAYERDECFDLQVAIDGPSDAPVDLFTLTPVDPALFKQAERDIDVGFSGSLGGDRTTTLADAINDGLIIHRKRTNVYGYGEHTRFMSRCKATINTSFTGSGQAHHIKGRVVEAGWAGCALLETMESPAHRLFPKGAIISYSDVGHVIKGLSKSQVDDSAAILGEYTRENLHPAMIYGEILDRINVAHSFPR